MCFGAQKYIADVHNVTADPSKGWQVPNQVAEGETQDISHIMQFHWLQPVLHLNPTASFPETKEEPAFFYGFAENCGDALTFELLLPDMKTRITRSVVRPAHDVKQQSQSEVCR